MQIRGNLFLLTAAFIWGSALVAQRVGMEYIGPFTYMATRFFLGTLFLLLIWFLYRGVRNTKKKNGTYRAGWKPGVIAGLVMFIAAAFQQYGMQYTTVSKTAFLTALYIVFVPLAGIFLKHNIKIENFIGALLAILGLYFLCMQDGFFLQYGDAIIFGCAIFWTLHILVISRYVADCDVIEISLIQVAVTCFLAFIVAFTFEDIILTDVIKSFIPIFYGGVFSTGVGFTLQLIGQQYAPPAVAAIIMGMESLFGTLSGCIFLGENLNAREIFGCVLMGSGMIVTQLSDIKVHKFRTKKK